jgi:hypothetical protein
MSKAVFSPFPRLPLKPDRSQSFSPRPIHHTSTRASFSNPRQLLAVVPRHQFRGPRCVLPKLIQLALPNWRIVSGMGNALLRFTSVPLRLNVTLARRTTRRDAGLVENSLWIAVLIPVPMLIRYGDQTIHCYSGRGNRCDRISRIVKRFESRHWAVGPLKRLRHGPEAESSPILSHGCESKSSSLSCSLSHSNKKTLSTVFLEKYCNSQTCRLTTERATGLAGRGRLPANEMRGGIKRITGRCNIGRSRKSKAEVPV